MPIVCIIFHGGTTPSCFFFYKNGYETFSIIFWLNGCQRPYNNIFWSNYYNKLETQGIVAPFAKFLV